MSDDAEFNESEHCIRPGWATYLPLTLRQRMCERFGGHRTSAPTPEKDYTPQAYSRCSRCRCALSYFNVGTHRRGGLSADTVKSMERAREDMRRLASVTATPRNGGVTWNG